MAELRLVSPQLEEPIPISWERCHALFDGAQVLRGDSARGALLARTGDGGLLERVPARPCWTSIERTPEWLRRIRVAERLRTLGVLAPHVARILAVRPGRWNVVEYRPLVGVDVRSVGRPPKGTPMLLDRLAAALARMHAMSVLLARDDLGNHLISASGELGVLRLCGVRFLARPPGLVRRVLAVCALTADDEDRRLVAAAGGAVRLWRAYADSAGLAPFERRAGHALARLLRSGASERLGAHGAIGGSLAIEWEPRNGRRRVRMRSGADLER